MTEVVRTEVREASAADSPKKPSKAVQVPSQRLVETEVKQTPKSVVPDLRMKMRSKKAEVASQSSADKGKNQFSKPSAPSPKMEEKPSKAAQVPSQDSAHSEVNQVSEPNIPDPKAKKQSKVAQGPSHGSADAEVNPVLEPKTPDHKGRNFLKSAKPHSLDAKENMPNLKVKKSAKAPQSSPQALADASENQVLESTVPDPKAKKNSKAARVSSHCSADLEETQKSESIVPGLEVEIPSFDENKLIGPYNWPPHDVLDLDSAVGKRYPALYDILTRYEFSLKIAKQETRGKLGEKGAWKGLNSADRQAAVLRG